APPPLSPPPPPRVPLWAPPPPWPGAPPRRFSDPRLRQLSGRSATYVGGNPRLSPALLNLVSHAEARGVWRVRGGMHRLAEALAALFTARGGTLRLSTHARRIERQSGRVRAVVTADGTRLPCRAALFAGDPRALSQGLLGQGLALPDAATEPRSLSALVWAFAATPQGPGLAHHNVFFGADPATEFKPLAQGHLPGDPTVYLCAQDRGTHLAPPALERFETIVNAPPLRGPGPEPDTCRQLTFQSLARHGLTFSPAPPDSALTTPQHFDALFPASLGSLYGRSPHGLTAALKRPQARTAVPGLYLAGGGAHPGAGVPMATLSGAHAAAAMRKDLASTSTSPRTATRGGMSTA
ncbi:phytoene desaturase family protein, partial [Oceaniglobus roseus]|uniref:phytoene desaturase family protein n=1 Tax=Oceaniglobus roseus TaxID=1737570 RepID=UPI0012FFEF90